MDFIESREEITADYAPGDVVEVPQHDGALIRLRKLAADYDPTDRIRVMNYLQQRAAAGEVVTGLLYIDPNAEDLHHHLNTVEAPLNQLGTRELCPGTVALERINASLR
jgi:2-oxoglutarate ferredoxin oxidoreductase subunit beta